MLLLPGIKPEDRICKICNSAIDLLNCKNLTSFREAILNPIFNTVRLTSINLLTPTTDFYTSENIINIET